MIEVSACANVRGAARNSASPQLCRLYKTMPFPLLLFAVAIAAAPIPALPASAPALDGFAAAWSKIDAYSVTVSVRESAGKNVQDRTYALTFAKPANETIVITRGPGRGGKVVWNGGDSVVGSPPGLLSGLKVHMSIADGRVTSLRGDTAPMASFGWILDHFVQTPGVRTETPGPLVDGKATTAISLAVADPSADAGLTQEVLVIDNATNLPVSGRSYVDAELVKDVRFIDVSVQSTTPLPIPANSARVSAPGH
jgi:hypothetical protein